MEPRQFLAYRSFVLALVVAQAHGQESGVELDHQYGILYELRDGRIVRMRAHLDPADAIEEMGRATRDARR
jgi:ketosteroid isomerase-like protein